MVAKTMILACFSLLAAGVAMAGFPDPTNFECSGPCIKVVGHDGTVGDPIGGYCVTIRDFNNVPIVNSTVVVDFSNCDIQLCADQMDPAVLVDCVSQTVRKLTDANGVACFRVIGKRRAVACATNPGYCAEVFADGVFACAVHAPVYDLVNEPGVGVSGNDFSEFLNLFFSCGAYLPAIDYNCNFTVDGDDFAQFLRVFFAGGSAQGCGTKCP